MPPDLSLSHSSISPSSRLSEKVKIEHPVHISPETFMHSGKIGRFSFINWNCQIYSEVEIGRYCSLGRNLTIAPEEHPTDRLSSSFLFVASAQFEQVAKNLSIQRLENKSSKTTVIGNDVWIGDGAFIKKGVTIGDGAVIGARAVVTKNVEPYAIVVGTPAKKRRLRFKRSTVRHLLQLAWWQLDIEDIATLPFDDIDQCILRLKEIRSKRSS